MKIALFFVAVLGWIAGLTVHVLAIRGTDVEDTIPYIWILHVGIFFVWLPTILEMRKNTELTSHRQSGIMNKLTPIGLFKRILKDTPMWLRVIAIAGFFYALINFLQFMISQPGIPEIENGQYILQNRGKLIRTLTEEEYHFYKANVLRGFSGHWIFFYGMAAAVLFPFKRQPNQDTNTA